MNACKALLTAVTFIYTVLLIFGVSSGQMSDVGMVGLIVMIHTGAVGILIIKALEDLK